MRHTFGIEDYELHDGIVEIIMRMIEPSPTASCTKCSTAVQFYNRGEGTAPGHGIRTSSVKITLRGNEISELGISVKCCVHHQTVFAPRE